MSSSPESSPESVASSSSPPAANEGFTAVYVKAWGSLALPAAVKAGDSVYWEFKTQAHDISFGVDFLEAGAKKPISIQPLTRIAKADQLLQHGSWIANKDGTVALNFDNTYSKLRGKNLLYKFSVSSAEDGDRNALPFGEIRFTTYGPAVIEGFREVDGIYTVALPYGQGYFNPVTLLAASNKQPPPRTINERCQIGVDMFFNNRIWESESFFRHDIEKYPVFSLAYGSLGFLRALMTWDKNDIAEANHRLKHTRHFVSALLPSVGAMKSVGRFFGTSTQPQMNKEELEHTLLQAESYLLQAMLLFTDESYLSFLKAGLKIRSAWKLYEKCEAQVASYDEATRASLDPSVLGGIKFGIGCFNVIISILPSIILRVVSALGFPSDRALGLRLLEECSSVIGIRQPLSLLMLLFVHIIIPSFFTVRPNYHIAKAKEILERAYKQYPNGALFLWMSGRLNRMYRSLPQAIDSFTRSAAGQPGWLQLQHLCAYELGFCHFFSLDFCASQPYWTRLEKENAWSKGFFCYMQAMCELAKQHGLSPENNESNEAFQKRLYLHQTHASLPYFRRIDSLITRKFGGKPLAVEAFISNRANALVNGGRRPVAAELEIIYLFYGFIQMSDPLLLRALQNIDNILSNSTKPRPDGSSPLTQDEICLCILIRSSILKALKRWNHAKVLLLDLAEKKDGELQQEKYVQPFGRFELAALILEQVVEKDAIMKGESCTGAAISPNQVASLDSPLPKLAKDGWSLIGGGEDAAPASASASSSSSSVAASPSPSPSPSPSNADWQSTRLELLDEAQAILRKCESNKSDYPFKNRLHLRIHLASVEITMLRKNWAEISGNVQNDADLKGSPDAFKDVVDSDEEESKD